MSRLRREAARLTRSSQSAATRRAYEADFADFAAWCRSARRSPLPASAETLELYVVDRLRTMKLASVERRVNGVRSAHVTQGHASPCGESVKEVLRGARRELGSRQDSKAALLPPDLRAISRELPRAFPKTCARDRAILMLGFAAALRRSEIIALDLADIEFVRKGLVVHIRRSKTDQEGRGRIAGVFFGRRASTCPVRSLRAWLRVRGRVAGPLFPGVGQTGRITPQAVNKMVKRCVELAGLDPRRYGAHSLRAGFVTAAAEAGVPETLIMQRTGHKSIQTVARYVRPATVFSVDALARAL